MAICHTMTASEGNSAPKATARHWTVVADSKGVSDTPVLQSLKDWYSGNASFKIGGKRLEEWCAFAKQEEQVVGSQTTTMASTKEEVVSTVASALVHQRLMTTRTGEFGWVPHAALPGDHICILLGCSTPLLLRQVGKEKRYQLIGTSYVHGIMHGEAMQGLEDGRYELEDFTIC